jgi:hypothetical protein
LRAGGFQSDGCPLQGSRDLREEGLVNHHVGPARARDDWDLLPSWTVNVGDLGIFRGADANEPWFVGEILEVVVNGSQRFGTQGETFVIHEMGRDTKRLVRVGDQNESESESAVSLYQQQCVGWWKFDAPQCYRYKTLPNHKGKNGGLDEYLPQKDGDLTKRLRVTSPHERDSLVWWAPVKDILTKNGVVLKKVLHILDRNPRVSWKLPPKDMVSAKQKRKRKERESE